MTRQGLCFRGADYGLPAGGGRARRRTAGVTHEGYGIFQREREKDCLSSGSWQDFCGQAPELFLLGKYYEANRALLPERILQINGSTEPAVMAGMDIVMIPGDEGNFKITTKADLIRFQERVGTA